MSFIFGLPDMFLVQDCQKKLLLLFNNLMQSDYLKRAFSLTYLNTKLPLLLNRFSELILIYKIS